MTDDPKAGLSVPETSGFEREPEAPAPPVNGHAATETPVDPLQVIATNADFPAALRVSAERLLAVESFLRQKRPDEFQVGEALAQFRTELSQVAGMVQQMGQVVTQLSQQRAIQEFMAERNARATALDLAIKALPEAERSPEATVIMAGAFLNWLKSGTQA